MRNNGSINRLIRNSKQAKLKLNLQSQIRFFSILAQMLHNGFSIHQALRFMKDFLPKEQAWITLLQHQLATGQNLAQALQYGRVDQALIDQIMIAQQHGHLIESLLQISHWLKIRAQERKKLNNLLSYPILLLGMLTVFFIGIKVVIQPQMQSFGGQNYHLPVPLKLSLWLSLLSLVILGGSFYRYWRVNSALNRAKLLIKLPIVGPIMAHYYVYLLCSNLAIFLANGLNLVDILRAVTLLPKQSLIRQLGQEVSEDLEHGAALENVIKKSQLLPDELCTFIYRGASIQLLSKEMKIYSQLRFEALIIALNKLFLKIQPVAFIVIALLILLMYLQLLLPIYNMMGAI